MKAEDLLDVEDHFCGAGGSTTGALLVDGVRVVHAANHSALAISTHSTNYPDVEHSLADIPSMDPMRVPKAAVLITSPECRARSYARGRPKDDPHLFAPGDGLDERSRATMDEVPRFAAARGYRAIVVENVPQLVDWCEPVESGHSEKCNCGVTFRRWLTDMTNLGYEHRKLFWNSAFFPPTPQSRDRIYVVFWRKGQRAPDLDYHPSCWCNACQSVVYGVQTAKSHLVKPGPVAKAWGPHDTVWGRYGQQYVYLCDACGERCVPSITPAATAIEWDRPAQRIGDRDRPLAEGTMARIRRGLERLPERPMVVPLDYLTAPDSRLARSAVEDVFSTLTGQHRGGLVVQVAGNLGRLRDGEVTRPVEESHVHGTERPLKVVHGSLDRAIAVPPRGMLVAQRENAVPRSTDVPMPTATTINSMYLLGGADRLVLSNQRGNVPALDGCEPMHTITTHEKMYAVDPWVVPYRRNTNMTRATEEPMHTVVAEGNQHYLLERPRMLVANYGGPSSGDSQQGWTRDPAGAPTGTLTTKDSHAIVEYRGKGNAGHDVDPLSTLATQEQHALVSVKIDIEDCTFRMLEPAEIGRGMVMHMNASGERYVIHGGRRDQVKQLGNAVTPPPMARIMVAIKDSLS